MKNKLLLSLLLVGALFTITACDDKEETKTNETNTKEEKKVENKGEKKELVFEDTHGNSGYKTTFNYYGNNFKVTETKLDVNGKYTNMIVESEKLGVNLSFAYTYYNFAKAYSSIKSNDSKTTNYKEYEWNGYKGYLSGSRNNYLSFMILLESDNSHDLIMVVTVTPLKDKDASVLDACKGSTIQNLLNSMKFTK